ncbi:uncharacterized protein LOC130499077 [Raphanus sativus]|uniref:Uncharacterized protein LOC130499077 n=1 Tax=Raphanus sativus TaxID=3726 RepID=A0A9W3CBQ6_RAPSA|nr:uncharacterized protein LOC130499077 [Raphanus sativus]
MSPKTRLAEKKEKAGASEKKKNAAVKRKEAAAKRRAAVKKKREASKRSETTKKKRKRDSGLDGGSSSNPTKRTRNRVRETAGSPPENEGVHSPTPNPTTPRPVSPSQPEKSPTPTHAANEAENPQQPRVTSGSSTKSPSHRVDEQNDEEIGSNNRDPNTPEVAVDNEAPRTVERDMTVEADRPAGFFFNPSDYQKGCKLSSRCRQHDFLTMLNAVDKFDASEKSWFQDHPQFKHIFHMDCTSTRKMMGLWMLLLRTMHTGKGRQAWFGVNGVPVRYSIREHSLISGLYCHSYPENYQKIGNMKFARKYFKVKKTKDGKEKGLQVTEEDVKEKLQKMKFDGSGDRLRMLVLYFLARVLRGRSKANYFIEYFLLQAVEDLEFCTKFPWGRYTFEDCMKEIFHVRDHFRDGIPEEAQWPFPGFINPLEILAFECIPVLREKFREPVPNCLDGCPRMCKWRFKRTGTTGFPLDMIYRTLGETKEIISILEPVGYELDLLYQIMDEGTFADLELKDDSDTPDIAVDSWNMILLQPGSKIFWPDLYEMDVRTREQQEEAGGEAGGEAGRERLRELEAGGNAGVEAGGEPGGEAGGEPGGEQE